MAKSRNSKAKLPEFKFESTTVKDNYAKLGNETEGSQWVFSDKMKFCLKGQPTII